METLASIFICNLRQAPSSCDLDHTSQLRPRESSYRYARVRKANKHQKTLGMKVQGVGTVDLRLHLEQTASWQTHRPPQYSATKLLLSLETSWCQNRTQGLQNEVSFLLWTPDSCHTVRLHQTSLVTFKTRGELGASTFTMACTKGRTRVVVPLAARTTGGASLTHILH